MKTPITKTPVIQTPILKGGRAKDEDTDNEDTDNEDIDNEDTDDEDKVVNEVGRDEVNLPTLRGDPLKCRMGNNVDHARGDGIAL